MKISERCGGQSPPYEKPPKILFAFSPFPLFPPSNTPARGQTGTSPRPQEQSVDRHQVLLHQRRLARLPAGTRRPRDPGARPPPAAGAPGLAPAAPRRAGGRPPRLGTAAAHDPQRLVVRALSGAVAPEALAPALVRLARWRQALQTAPPPPGPTPELAWVQALDEAHTLLCRYALAGGDARPTAGEDDSPLVAWRRRVTRIYADLMRQGGWLSPGELPAYLTAALRQGRIKLPPRVLVAGLETPAPMEELWLQEVSRRTQVVHLQVRGDLENVRQAVALPDPGQELHWVAARLVELARAACRCTAWPSPPRTSKPMPRNCAGSWPNCWGRPSPRTAGLTISPRGPTCPKSPSFGPRCCP